jgi:ribosomal protein S18 acetylase RimI-like enzyme
LLRDLSAHALIVDGGTMTSENEANHGLVIRPFREDDTQDVIALWQRCGLTRPWNDPKKDIARKLQVQPQLFVVGIEDGAVVASVMAGYDGHRGWINYLAVDAPFRGRGYARALMTYVENALRAIGCPKLNMQVRASNAEVLAFYYHLGYVQDEALSLGKRLISDE